MPNQPKPGTVATSFTLPKDLLDAVEALAAKEMTNKSDIIRRALMNYLSPAEREAVRTQSLRAAEKPEHPYGSKKQQRPPKAA
jgi:Arc/MetJ-type ribon-helix-helix transcriptional regulator